MCGCGAGDRCRDGQPLPDQSIGRRPRWLVRAKAPKSQGQRGARWRCDRVLGMNASEFLRRSGLAAGRWGRWFSAAFAPRRWVICAACCVWVSTVDGDAA
ncbi:hypothetical protein ZWY2020_049356 [Hordeum vulgare]|nr:hypothetical protein ZWY2020_049356 [Hordeum vulgare]